MRSISVLAVLDESGREESLSGLSLGVEEITHTGTGSIEFANDSWT